MNVALQNPELVSAAAIDAPSDMTDPVVIIGGGPVGMRMAHELSRRGLHVILFNAERWRPYNRVKLTPLLAGEAQLGQVYVSEYFPTPGKVTRFDGVSITAIDPEEKAVLASTGRVVRYSKLVLALGSRAFIPGVPGKNLPGVFAFRNFDDVEALIARSMSARKVVVMGGGLLGLEAARGMSRRGADVTVVEHETRLMPRQLDEDSAALLKSKIEALGIKVITGTRVERIQGEAWVESIALSNGETLTADTLIICTGVRANIQLPSATGLGFNRGVLVDDQMRSSDPDIYAVGECAEHNGTVYGLVGPCYEQVMVAAAAIAGEDAAYQGSVPATKLKVLGADVFSIGDFESVEQQPASRSYTFRDDEAGVYRRIFLRRGKLLGALGVGDWPEATRLQQAVSKGQSVQFWHIASFKKTGRLWKEDQKGVIAWPREAIVCNCTGVTKGAITDACTLGAETLEEVRAATSANSVCGACKPLVMDLLGQGAPPEPVRWWKWLLAISAIAALVATCIAVLPRIALADTYAIGDPLAKMWFDSIWKQYSGYTLLGLSAAAAILGLRKRIGIFRRLGGYDWWRIAHLFIGVAATGALVWHTGFRLGANLNLALMLCFIATLVFGAVAGLLTGGEHKLREEGLVEGPKSPRSLPMWVHILAVWPLPLLLLFHILSVYAY